MKPTIPWMKQAFDEYNAKYFDGKLEQPRFSLKCNDNLWGFYQPDATFSNITRKTTVKSPGIIYLNSRYSRDEKDWIGTLLHEMIHMYINTVLRIYPKNSHGDEFYNLASNINKDGWNISESNEMKTTDTLDDDNEENVDYNNNIIKPNIFCIIEQPSNNTFKMWGFKAEFNQLNDYINTARTLKQKGGATLLHIYYCYSKNMKNLPTSSKTLDGIGANNLTELNNKLCKILNEKLYTTNFKLYKTITL